MRNKNVARSEDMEADDELVSSPLVTADSKAKCQLESNVSDQGKVLLVGQ